MNLKEIHQPLESITALGYNLTEVYRDWHILMLTALLKDEEQYLFIMNKYKRANDTKPAGERPADKFAEAYANLMMAWNHEFKDYLGELYEEHVTRGEHGQFFTPEHLCTMMARMTCPNLKDGQTVCDPACGSARNLMAAAKVNGNAIFYGVDLDARCVTMATLSMLHMNTTSYIVCGNTLSLETYHGYATHYTPTGGIVRKLTMDECEAIVGKVHKTVKADNDNIRLDQLALF